MVKKKREDLNQCVFLVIFLIFVCLILFGFIMIFYSNNVVLKNDLKNLYNRTNVFVSELDKCESRSCPVCDPVEKVVEVERVIYINNTVEIVKGELTGYSCPDCECIGYNCYIKDRELCVEAVILDTNLSFYELQVEAELDLEPWRLEHCKSCGSEVWCRK